VTVAGRQNGPFRVGSAAESRGLLRLVEENRRRQKLQLTVADRTQDAFGDGVHGITLLDDTAQYQLSLEEPPLVRRLVADIVSAFLRFKMHANRCLLSF
jgi:hypothetical protein